MKKKINTWDKRIFALAVEVTEQYAKRHGLRLKLVEVQSSKVKDAYGQCHWDGRITYDLRGLEPYRILDLIAHELAHLSHWEHNEKFLRLWAELLLDMTERGELARLTAVCPVAPT